MYPKGAEHVAFDRESATDCDQFRCVERFVRAPWIDEQVRKQLKTELTTAINGPEDPVISRKLLGALLQEAADYEPALGQVGTQMIEEVQEFGISIRIKEAV